MRKKLLIFGAGLAALSLAASDWTYRYWFDNDEHAVSATGGNTAFSENIDLSSLPAGLHAIYLQAIDDKGTPSAPAIRYFLKAPTSMASEGLVSYWFDNDKTPIGAIDANAADVTIDVSKLHEGLHTLHLQSTSTGTPSSICSQTFIKMPQLSGTDDLTCLISIDGEHYKKQKISYAEGIMHLDLDSKPISNGFHQLSVQVVTASGTASTICNSYFLRQHTAEEASQMRCYCLFDNGSTQINSTGYDNGIFHFNFDVEELANGFHQAVFMMVDGEGNASQINNAFFFKTPVGGYYITHYEYWLNDEWDNCKRVKVSSKDQLIRITDLLPMESKPLASDNFKFEINANGEPYIYACNDFHARFYSSDGRTTEDYKTYTDYAVGKKVENAELIEGIGAVKKLKPANNQIHWYRVPMQVGDSLSLYTDNSCTIQLFSPTSQEVYRADGSKSVTPNGIHALEDGDYYVAVHDALSQNYSHTTLSYAHIDKYAVLDYDVHTVGNGGMSTITLNGNGFDNLYAAELTNGAGQKISCFDIGHEKDSSTSITFDFADVDLGSYDAILHFADQDICISDMIQVEEPDDLEFDFSINYPSQYLRGSSTTYNVQIHNGGNMSAYFVPVELCLRTSSFDEIKSINFDGYVQSLTSPFSSLSGEIDEDLLRDLKQVFSDISDKCLFTVAFDSIEGKDVAISHLILNIPPNANIAFSVSVNSPNPIELNAYIAPSWVSLSTNYANKPLRSITKERVNNICCMRERVECLGDVTATILGNVLPPGANCLATFSITGLETFYDTWCQDGEDMSERWHNYLESQGSALKSRVINSVVSCVLRFFDVQLKNLKTDRVNAAKWGSTTEVLRITDEINKLEVLCKNTIRSIYKSVINTSTL